MLIILFGNVKSICLICLKLTFKLIIMKLKLFILAFIFINFLGFSQSALTVEKDYWSGKAIFRNGSKISIEDAKELMKNNNELLQKLSSAQTNRTIGAIVGYPSAFVFGYTLGESFKRNGNPNWTVGGIGIAGTILGMILEGKGNKKLKEVVEIYNTNLNKNTSSFNPEFSVSSSENGIGLTMRF
jgi:hypothetical protein